PGPAPRRARGRDRDAVGVGGAQPLPARNPAGPGSTRAGLGPARGAAAVRGGNRLRAALGERELLPQRHRPHRADDTIADGHIQRRGRLPYTTLFRSGSGRGPLRHASALSVHPAGRGPRGRRRPAAAAGRAGGRAAGVDGPRSRDLRPARGVVGTSVEQQRDRIHRPARPQPASRHRQRCSCGRNTPMNPLITGLAGSLIVSCQAYPGEATRDPRTMAQVAQAVRAGGASAVRAQGLEDIRAVKAAVDVPVIGIWKDGVDGVFITPTLDHCRAVVEAGADLLALDRTLRPRFDGPLMADCDNVESALAAAELGIEIIGTTLAGYTDARERPPGPDLDLLAELAGALPTASVLVAEGRVHTPAHAAAARAAGAFAVVVGTAITHPTTITTWFRDAVTAAPQR